MSSIYSMQTYRMLVAGTKYRKQAYACASPARGDAVTLIPEPDNSADKDAIKVMKGEWHFGYVPRAFIVDVQEAVKTGSYKAEVRSSRPGGCEISVTVIKEGDYAKTIQKPNNAGEA